MFVGHREYHVQFFGSVAERAWIHEKRIVVYKGESQFEELQAETLRKTTNPTERQKVHLVFYSYTLFRFNSYLIMK